MLRTDRKNESKNSNSGYFNEWEAIVNAKDLHKALINHFSYLDKMAPLLGLKSVG
ncbi:hypothetical protein LEP1GSC133_5213 [Leptospira borgpetersenii serovar Pomona str. 200901868]|uniref:Uncharacterized protein n=1 Tax=Leptospira borgpetersenii serovar Pomona str. 200901868 TaxID=1192866 RepID=M6VTS8_LEPBO|nr:hypothetical protein LEP1GSC133_5213 [Leptospira borgpetersenii serovar Pomona str. 200901868]